MKSITHLNIILYNINSLAQPNYSFGSSELRYTQIGTNYICGRHLRIYNYLCMKVAYEATDGTDIWTN